MEPVFSLLNLQQEAESNLRKAKQGYGQRCEDHDKARLLVAKAEEEQAGTGPGAGGTVSKALDKRRRLEEEAKNKVRTGRKGEAEDEAPWWRSPLGLCPGCASCWESPTSDPTIPLAGFLCGA